MPDKRNLGAGHRRPSHVARGWCGCQRVVRGRIAASIPWAGRGLAVASGIVPRSSDKPLLDDAARDVGVRSATSAVLRVVDLPALERQAVAATRASARSRGAGPPPRDVLHLPDVGPRDGCR